MSNMPAITITTKPTANAGPVVGMRS
jgi:hypothetical protein